MRSIFTKNLQNQFLDGFWFSFGSGPDFCIKNCICSKGHDDVDRRDAVVFDRVRKALGPPPPEYYEDLVAALLHY